MRKFFMNYEVYEDGTTKKVKISRRKVEKRIDEMIKRDKELLEILEKL